MPGLKPEIVVHHQAHASLCGDIHDGARLIHRRRQRFLTEDMHAPSCRQFDQGQMVWGVVMISMKSGRSRSSMAAASAYVRGTAYVRAACSAWLASGLHSATSSAWSSRCQASK